MTILGKDALKRITLKRKTVHVPEWEGEIILRELNGQEAIAFQEGAMEISQQRQAGALKPETLIRWQAQTVALGWINEDGSYVLQGSDDIDELLRTQPHPLIERLAKEVRALSGMEKAKEDDPETIEQAKKN
jgi:hypothetical protein